MKLFQHPTDYASGQLVKLKKHPADDVSVGCFFASPIQWLNMR